MPESPDPAARPRSTPLLEILDELFEGDARELYVGAAQTVSGPPSLGCHVMVSAAVREIMDLIEKAAGYDHSPPDWKERVRKLEKAWRIAEHSETGSGAGIAGFAPVLNDFFETANSLPRRRDLATGTLQQFDPTMRETSPTVQEQRAARWMSFRKYFSDVLHRNFRPAHEDFEAQFDAFEEFLIRWLRPPTFDDYDAIEALLREGPPSA